MTKCSNTLDIVYGPTRDNKWEIKAESAVGIRSIMCMYVYHQRINCMNGHV